MKIIILVISLLFPSIVLAKGLVTIDSGTYVVKVHIQGNTESYEVESSLIKNENNYTFDFRGNAVGVANDKEILFGSSSKRVCGNLVSSYVIRLIPTSNSSFVGTSIETMELCETDCSDCVSSTYSIDITGKKK